jgi:rod shape determining protein RodA
MNYDSLETSRAQRTLTGGARLLLALHLDGPLVIGLCLLVAVGTIVLFSASGRSISMLEAKGLHFVMALVVMIALAQVPPRMIRMATPWVYLLGLILLIAVMFTGDIAMGAQRWLDLGVVRFQP